MSVVIGLNKILIFIPLCILGIIILDLLRNWSLFTQYLHWTVFAIMGTTAAIFTGESILVISLT